MSNESELTSEQTLCECGEAIVEVAPTFWAAKGYEVCKDSHWHKPAGEHRRSAPQDESLRITEANCRNEQEGPVNVPSVFRPAPDSGKGFDEWIAEIYPDMNILGCEPQKQNMKAAWNAALESRTTQCGATYEGLSKGWNEAFSPEANSTGKITWRVDWLSAADRWCFFNLVESERKGRSLLDCPSKALRLVKIETRETVVETRKRGE